MRSAGSASVSGRLTGLTPGDLVLGRMERLPFSRFHARVAALLGVGTFFDGFDAIAISAALPVVTTTMRINFLGAGALISAAYAGQLLGALVFGAIGDRIGRRLSFIVPMAGFGLLSLLSALAWDYRSLFIFRFLQGIGLGAEVPVAAALFNELVGSRIRGVALYSYEVLFGWGSAAAPLAGALLFAAFGPQLGWRYLFVVGTIPLVAAAVAWFRLPESPRWLVDRGHVDRAERIVAAMEEEARRRHPQLAEPAPIPRTAGARTRLLELFAPAYRRRTALTWTMWFTGFFVFWGYSAWMPTVYVRMGGLAVTAALGLAGITQVIANCSAFGWMFLVEGVGRKPVFAIGFGVTLAAWLIALVVAGAFHFTAWPVLFAAGTVAGVALAAPDIGCWLYTPELFPTRMRAWATSTGAAVNKLATIIAPVVIGALIQAGRGITSVFALMAVMSLAGLCVVLVLGIETKGRTLEELST
jgi:putative MFS transporter